MQKQLLLLPILLFAASCSSLPCFGSDDAACDADVESNTTAEANHTMPTDPDPAPPSYLEIMNFTVLDGKVAGGGSITAEQVATLPSLGYTTIINLQGENEPGVRAEAAAAHAAGLNYISIPVGGDTFTLEDGNAVAKALAQYPGHALLHCRSGGRVSAIWALTRAINEGLTAEEAMNVAANEGCRPIPESMVKRVGAELTPR